MEYFGANMGKKSVGCIKLYTVIKFGRNDMYFKSIGADLGDEADLLTLQILALNWKHDMTHELSDCSDAKLFIWRQQSYSLLIMYFFNYFIYLFGSTPLSCWLPVKKKKKKA